MNDASRNKSFGVIALVALFLLVWVAGWTMERFDYFHHLPEAPLAALQPAVDTLAIRFPFLSQLFSFRVLRHLVPAVIGWILARSAALGLIEALFDLPDRQGARLFLKRSQAAENPPGAPVAIRRSNFAKDRLQQPLLRYGGPGRVRVQQGDVIWTERNGRFQRVLGSGSPLLERYEYVRGVLDLRPQERGETRIRLTTKDGIELQTDVSLTYQIHRGEEGPTEREPFPYDEAAIRQAGYAETVLVDGHIDGWDTLPLRVVVRRLRQIVGRRTLDGLLFRQDNRPLEDIKTRLLRDSRRDLEKSGIDLINIRLGRLEIPDEVIQQRIEHWQSFWQEWQRRREAAGTAEALVLVEKARAQAKAEAIQRILEGLREGQQALHMGGTREMVALRLVDAMERITSQVRPMQPARELSSRLGKIKQEIQGNHSG